MAEISTMVVTSSRVRKPATRTADRAGPVPVGSVRAFTENPGAGPTAP